VKTVVVIEIPDQFVGKCDCGKPIADGEFFFLIGRMHEGKVQVAQISSGCMDNYIQEVIHQHEADHQQMAQEKPQDKPQGEPDAQQ
jgi:hypothetical protein